MTIEVLFFARARDLAGCPSLMLTLPDGAKAGDARRVLADVCPDLAPLLPAMFLALDQDYVDDTTPLRNGCTIACFPPVSGG